MEIPKRQQRLCKDSLSVIRKNVGATFGVFNRPCERGAGPGLEAFIENPSRTSTLKIAPSISKRMS